MCGACPVPHFFIMDDPAHRVRPDRLAKPPATIWRLMMGFAKGSTHLRTLPKFDRGVVLADQHQTGGQKRQDRQYQQTEGGACGGILDPADQIWTAEPGEVAD